MSFCKPALFCSFFVLLTTLVSCRRPPVEDTLLKSFPLNGLEGIVTRSGVSFDKEISTDGGGSLRIIAREPMTVRLFEVEGLDIENARLIYRARLRTQNVEGQAYLEMWCRLPGRGEFFSRGIKSSLGGTTGWVTEETPFFLKKGQKPDLVKLNLVVKGRGTVWIDDVRLLKAPLR